MENVDHLKRIGHLDAELKEGEKINGQREFLESVSQLRESITRISEQLDREVSVCLKILDSEDVGVCVCECYFLFASKVAFVDVPHLESLDCTHILLSIILQMSC